MERAGEGMEGKGMTVTRKRRKPSQPSYLVAPCRLILLLIEAVHLPGELGV